MRTLGLLSAMILLSACGGSIPIVPTGSGSLAADGDGLRLVAANATEGSLSIVNLERNGVVEVAVGQAPTRLVVLGERAIATLRGERALVEVDLRTVRAEFCGRGPKGERVTVTAAKIGL